jgi:hypothetical protein
VVSYERYFRRDRTMLMYKDTLDFIINEKYSNRLDQIRLFIEYCLTCSDDYVLWDIVDMSSLQEYDLYGEDIIQDELRYLYRMINEDKLLENL